MRIVAILLALAGPVAAQDVPVAAESAAAIRAAASGDYQPAQVSEDAAIRDLGLWIRLRDGAAAFDEYQAFSAARPDWPDQQLLRSRAEEALPKGSDGDMVLAWFGDTDPLTGEGAVRLAEALIGKGRISEAAEVVRRAWRELRLTEKGEQLLLRGFADQLAPEHVARVNMLLWASRVDEARRMLDLLDPDHAALARARIAYIRNSGITEAVAAVPETLRDDAGLAYDRYNWLANQGERTEAIAILQARSVSAEALGEPFRWSGWRRSLARWQMREGNAELAYELASRHFLTEGESFADLEWLAGYLQLTYLGSPTQALAHFDRAAVDVEGPISISRMAYWQGRAQEALGDAEAARAAYQVAAPHQTAFYGLLAAEKLGLTLDAALADRDARFDPAVLEDDLVRAAFTLLEAGQRGYATRFFVQMGVNLPAETLRHVGAVMHTADRAYFAVAMGKAAVSAGKLVPSIYFPLHPLAQEDTRVEPALALSIARRESEFNAGVGSPVGALGLMQLMPATAKEVAGFEGLPYNRALLTTDWAYNAQLGTRYLAELQDRFGPSVTQIAAGYNAGPSRPEQWMDERGDPRIGEADVVDWIEHIPFRETRNYVQRVSESIPVYRARLTGEVAPVAFTALLVGRKPLIRPRARALPTEVPATVGLSDTGPIRAMARPEAPAAPAAPAGIRPIARPGG